MGGLPTGAHDVWAKHARYLSVCQALTLSGTHTLTLAQMRAGDASNNDIVNIQDFSLLASQFGQSGNLPSDFNGDGIVNIADFSLLASNFGQSGCTAGAPFAPSEVVSPTGSVALYVHLANRTMMVNDVFDVPMIVMAGAQTLDGAAAYPNFDPTKLEVVSVTPGIAFSQILQNSFDNTTGQINFAAGTLSAPYPSGSFTLLTVRFRALAVVPASTAVTFSTAVAQQSDV